MIVAIVVCFLMLSDLASKFGYLNAQLRDIRTPITRDEPENMI